MIFGNMFKHFLVSLSLLTLCGLVLCGCTERTEENDTPLLSEDLEPSFQLIGDPRGSLIPPEEVPVVSVEITGQDAENVFWRLKAAPAPKYEDLVVRIKHDYPRNYSRFFVVIPKNKTHSAEFQSLRYSEAWRWQVRRDVSERRDMECVIFVPEEDVGDYWYWLLTSDENGIDENEYIPVLQGEKVWNAEQERWEWIFSSGFACDPYHWHLYVPENRIIVESAETMIWHVTNIVKSRAISSDNFTYSMDYLLTDDGYVIPHGFHFTYYHAMPSVLLPNIKEESPKPDAPDAPPDID